MNDHRTGQNRYTKSRLPVELVFAKQFSTLKEARKFEYFIKRQRNKEFYKRLIQGAIV